MSSLHGKVGKVSLLLDTHAFLWWLSESSRLSIPAHRTIADPANEILVSAATAWEITTKFRIGKLPARKPVALDVSEHIASQGFSELAISVADAEHAGRLQGAHRDPFDRMLAAQALVRDLRIVSIDTAFDQFGVHRVW